MWRERSGRNERLTKQLVLWPEKQMEALHMSKMEATFKRVQHGGQQCSMVGSTTAVVRALSLGRREEGVATLLKLTDA